MLLLCISVFNEMGMNKKKPIDRKSELLEISKCANPSKKLLAKKEVLYKLAQALEERIPVIKK